MSMDEILRGYSILSSLKSNIPDNYEIEKYWVDEYHFAIEKLEKSTNIDLSDFYVPDHRLHYPIDAAIDETEIEYGKTLMCERSVLIQQLDAILIYFSGIQSGKDKTIGFIKP